MSNLLVRDLSIGNETESSLSMLERGQLNHIYGGEGTTVPCEAKAIVITEKNGTRTTVILCK